MSTTIQKYKDYVMTGFMKSVAPIVIDHAAGAQVWDDTGREYLDCFSGISVVNAGHNNPKVISAAKAQMDKLVHCASYLYHAQPVADLAEKIAQIAPQGLTKTFFVNGGSELNTRTDQQPLAGGQGQVSPVEFSSAAEGRRGLQLDGRVEREAFEEVSASASTLGSDFGRDRVAGL